MMAGARRAWLRQAGAVLGSAALPLAACSNELLSRFQGVHLGTPCELLLWGLPQDSADALASRVWTRLDAFDHDWRQSPAAARAQLPADLGPVAERGATPDIAWRGLALDAAAGELTGPDLGGALLTVGQHLLAIGERGYRAWHVGIPDPVTGHTLLGLDLYANERLVTVASYARYRDPSAPDPGATATAPDGGAGACASCSVVVRDVSTARAALLAQTLFQSAAAQWPQQAHVLGAATVLWVGRDGSAEATPTFARRSQMSDLRRTLTERPGS